MGTKTLAYFVAANPATTARNATITVGSATLVVTQAGMTVATCNATLSPTSASFQASGGSGSFNVTIPAGCNWTATPRASWITITAGATGSGNGSVSYTVQANTSSSSLTGAIGVADQQFTINVAGAQAGATLTASPNPITACNAAGLGVTTLTWNAPGFDSTAINITSPSGPNITTGGSTGVVTTGYWVPDGAQFFLVDSAGNTLAQVTVRANCGQLGTVPVMELTEMNAADWLFKATAGAAPADIGAFDETNSFRVGNASVGAGTNGGDTITATYPNPASQPVLWDLSDFNSINLWLSTDTGRAGFPSGYPTIQLSSAGGQLTIVPSTALLANAQQGWFNMTIPLATGGIWTVTPTAGFDITHVTSIQLVFKASGTGLGVLMDGLQFQP
jgi:hypothetical protein